MSERPSKLPFPATRVVKALPDEMLPWSLKGLWLEHVALDHSPEGCYLGATGMAERTGLSPHTVERGRRVLATIGFLVKLPAPLGATAGWVPTLPDHCVPDTRALTPQQLGKWSARLSAHLEKWQSMIHRSELAEEPTGCQSGSPLAASREDNAAADRLPLPARTSRATGSQVAGGMEMLEKVGENLQHQVGGFARARNGKRPEKQKSVLSPEDRQRALESDPKLRDTMERLQQKKDRLAHELDEPGGS